MKSRIKLIYFLIAYLISLPVSAQFGDLLKELSKLGSSVQKNINNSQATTKTKNARISEDQWCAEQVGVLNGISNDLTVIKNEFNVSNLESLQDEFLKAFRNKNLSKTFPSADFFKSSFETKKVRAIYDSFLAWPEPQTLAALIHISNSRDQQESVDALMALVFLHLQASELSSSKDRWWELFQKTTGVKHYTSLVFRARINAYGEYGKKDLGEALGDLNEAGALPRNYPEESKEFDSQNHQEIHYQTVKDIFYNEPNMPYRRQWEGMAKIALDVEKAQKQFAMNFPNTRLGKMYAHARKINQEAQKIGDDIIKKTQGGNQYTGQIESLNSLRENLRGAKPVFEVIDPEVNALQIKMMQSSGAGLDKEQVDLLVTAQEKRLVAQGIVYNSVAELARLLLAGAGFGDMVKILAPDPALRDMNNALIQSCLISAKWDQAMRAKSISTDNLTQVARSKVADLQNKFPD